MFKKFKVGDLVNFRPLRGRFDMEAWVVTEATLFPADIEVCYFIERVSDHKKEDFVTQWDLRFARNPNPIEG